MQVLQVEHMNPGASMPLIVPVVVLPNTPEDVGDAQIRANAALPLPWLFETPELLRPKVPLVICGGGPSLEDSEEEIERLLLSGAMLMGLNGASLWLSAKGIRPEWQVILDAKEETSALVDERALYRLYSSQVHPSTAAHATMLFHLNNIGIEDLLPPDRVADGGYTLVGGGVSVGITALCVAYTLGFRELHLFGYDSSNRADATHAYPQQMNALIPQIDVEWGGKAYRASMPMKLQAEAFPKFAEALVEAGCKIHVYGDGLLPAMWRTPPMTEREKYQQLWSRSDYRSWSPGEDAVPTFLEVANPTGNVLDFGCGTGRAMLAMKEAGLNPIGIDFTDNCRDRAAMILPFIQWDLTKPIPVKAKYGFCADVMEHIPPDAVDLALANIMASAEHVFFQIATTPDNFGAAIGQKLHLTVKPHEWWAGKFGCIEWQETDGRASRFYVKGER